MKLQQLKTIFKGEIMEVLQTDYVIVLKNDEELFFNSSEELEEGINDNKGNIEQAYSKDWIQGLDGEPEEGEVISYSID